MFSSRPFLPRFSHIQFMVIPSLQLGVFLNDLIRFAFWTACSGLGWGQGWGGARVHPGIWVKEIWEMTRAGMGAGLQAESSWDIWELLRMVKQPDFICMSCRAARAWGVSDRLVRFPSPLLSYTNRKVFGRVWSVSVLASNPAGGLDSFLFHGWRNASLER